MAGGDNNLSGKNGKLLIGGSEMADVRNVKITYKSNNPQFGTSSTAGHKVSVPGTKSGTVTFQLVLNTTMLVESKVKAGDAVTLTVDRDGGGTAATQHAIPVRIDEIGEEIDINDGGELVVDVSASTNGQWTYPNGVLST